MGALDADAKRSVTRLSKRGASVREISRKIGHSESAVRAYRSKLGLGRSYTRLPTPPIPRGFRSRLDENPKELSLRFGVSEFVIGRWLRRLELDDLFPDIRHGSANTYTKRKCRCDTCISAHRAAQQNARSLRLLQTMLNDGVAPILTHNAQTFNNWGCKCDKCATAKGEANASYKSRLRVQRAGREARASASRTGI